MKKRIFSFLMAVAMVVSILPVPVLAAEGCANHPEHDESCGYVAAVEGQPCTHQHSEDCRVEAVNCTHVHTAECYPEGNMDGEPSLCEHVCSEESGCVTVSCNHVHDGECGYVEAVEGKPCGHSCELCDPPVSTESEPVEKDPVCTCETKCNEMVNNDCPVCGVPGADLAGCIGKEKPTCNCETKCAEGAVKTDCPICGVEGADLTGCAGKEAPIVTEAALAVQALMDALPSLDAVKAITDEDTWYAALAQAQDAYEAWLELSEEEMAMVDASRAEELLTYFKDAQINTLDIVSADYLDAGGNFQTQENCTLVTSNMTAWNAGWYVVDSSNISIGNRIEVTGAVHLILADGYKLTSSQGIHVPEGSSLTIYGQAECSGELSVTGAGNNNAGIGGNGGESNGPITVNGGKINVQGGYDASGIGSGRSATGKNITINRGSVTATGGKFGAGIGGSGGGGSAENITINGGTVNATGGANATGIGGGSDNGRTGGDGKNISINGGYVTAQGGQSAAGIGGGISGIGENISISGTGTVVIARKGQGAKDNIGSGTDKASTSGSVTRKDAWIVEGTNIGLYGDKTLSQNMTIPVGYTLTIPEGITLTIPENVTVTNNGAIAGGGTLRNNGTILGPGEIGEAVKIEGSGVIKAGGISIPKTMDLYFGEPVTLTPKVNPACATDYTEITEISWVSSNTDVATVENGVISPVAKGTANITVKGNVGDTEYTATCAVTVLCHIGSVTLDKTEADMVAGNSLQLNVTLAPECAQDQPVTWTSSDPAVATVDANGLVEAVSEGEATITVHTKEADQSASCTVNVENAVAMIFWYDTYYASLTEAVEAAQDSDTVCLVENVELSTAHGIKLHSRLDLNEHTITVNTVYAIDVEEGKSASITNGKILIVQGAVVPYSFWVKGTLSSDALIEGGINLEGGTLEGRGTYAGDIVGANGAIRNGSFGGTVSGCTITGGSFKNDPSKDSSNKIPEGKEVLNVGGDYPYMVVDTGAVAERGDRYYSTLTEAVTYAYVGTVNLLRDVTETITVSRFYDLELNLGSHTVTGDVTVEYRDWYPTSLDIRTAPGGGINGTLTVSSGANLSAQGNGLNCHVVNNGTISGGFYQGKVTMGEGSNVRGGCFNELEGGIPEGLTKVGTGQTYVDAEGNVKTYAFCLVSGPVNAIAEVNGLPCTDLETAIAAAGDKGTVKLLVDVTDETLVIDKDVTVDLNGQKLTVAEVKAGTFVDNAEKKGSLQSTAISNGAFSCDVIIDKGNTVKNGTFTGGVMNYGEIYNGTFKGPVNNYGEICNGTFQGLVYNRGMISGGQFTHTGGNGFDQTDVLNWGTISGGDFSGVVYCSQYGPGYITGGYFQEDGIQGESGVAENRGYKAIETDREGFYWQVVPYFHNVGWSVTDIVGGQKISSSECQFCGQSFWVEITANPEYQYDGTAKPAALKFSDNWPETVAKPEIKYSAEPVNVGEITAFITMDKLTQGVVLPLTDDTVTAEVTYKITKAPVTIKADDKKATEGDPMPTLTYTISGLLGNDELVKEPTLACNADMSKPGEYTITASGADAGGNYEINYVPGKLTVEARSIFTVTFDSHGGSSVAVQTVKSGNMVIKPTDPTRSKHTFKGWFTDEKCTKPYDFDTPVTADLTLHAKWAEVYTFTLNYKANTSATVRSMPKDETVTSEREEMTFRLSYSKPKRSGYTFTGWNTQSNGKGTKYQPGDDVPGIKDGTVTLYAQWKQTSGSWWDNPKTGDYIMIAVAVLAVSGAALAGMLVYAKKKKK